MVPCSCEQSARSNERDLEEYEGIEEGDCDRGDVRR